MRCSVRARGMSTCVHEHLMSRVAAGDWRAGETKDARRPTSSFYSPSIFSTAVYSVYSVLISRRQGHTCQGGRKAAGTCTCTCARSTVSLDPWILGLVVPTSNVHSKQAGLAAIHSCLLGPRLRPPSGVQLLSASVFCRCMLYILLGGSSSRFGQFGRSGSFRVHAIAPVLDQLDADADAFAFGCVRVQR